MYLCQSKVAENLSQREYVIQDRSTQLDMADRV